MQLVFLVATSGREWKWTLILSRYNLSRERWESNSRHGDVSINRARLQSVSAELINRINRVCWNMISQKYSFLQIVVLINELVMNTE